MTTKYEPVKLWVDKKDHRRLQIEVLRRGKYKSVSHFFREKAKEYIKSK